MQFRGWTTLLVFLLGWAGPIAWGAPTTRVQIQSELHSAATQSGVPYELLAGIAFLESRWTLPHSVGDGEHPPVYGVMGLRDDPWFGSSASRAAALAGVSKSEVETDLRSNVRGAALLLRELELRIDPGAFASSDLRRWERAAVLYTGIPSKEDQDLYWEDLLRVLALGYLRSGISVPGNEELRQAISTIKGLTSLAKKASTIEWDPSPNFDPGLITQRYVVIHTTEGSFASAVSWLKNPQANASAHYVIRASDGFIKNLVHESDRAWHVRCWNPVAIGVEHEGFVEDPESYTEPMVQSSAKLVKRIVADYSIPIDDMHVFGHDFWMTARYHQAPPADLPDCNDHTDPGIYWDWSKYFGLLGL